MKKFDLQVNRKDFHQFKIVEQDNWTEADLVDGQILVAIEQFAFTANNITYAAVGEMVGYWKFFPVSEDWGIIPVWGFSKVLASKNEQIKVGERFYGYYPMGSHLIMTPSKIRPTGFTDIITHRQALPPIYNNYTNTQTDPAYTPEGEALQSLFRPLFTTSFLLDDFMEDNAFFDSKNLILTSASSKTAIGLAFLLAQRKANAAIKIIGLTSTSNIDFVKGLGYYDQVFSYDQVRHLNKAQKSVIVDFSGNAQVQQNLQSHLGNHLSYNCLVGMVDWTKRGGVDSAAQNGTFFFAPTQAVKRHRDWGEEGFQMRIGKAWMQFTTKTNAWLEVKETQGAEGLAALYPRMLDGNMQPHIGHIVKL